MLKIMDNLWITQPSFAEMYAACVADGIIPPSATTKGMFVVKEHHASQLHFDFRLQSGRVFVSWVIGQEGPTMVAGEKRMAIEVPDHSLSFREGIIPQGRYGAGLVLNWDKGIYRLQPGIDLERALLYGELTFELFGKKLRGAFRLLRQNTSSRRRTWIITKLDDEFSDPNWKLQYEEQPRPRRHSNFRQHFFNFDRQ